MKFLKITLTALAVIGLTAAAAVYFSDKLLENEIRIILADAGTELAHRDLYLAKPDFESARFTSLRSFAVNRFSAGVVPLRTERFASGSRWTVEARRIEVEIHRYLVRVRLYDFHLDVEGKGDFSGSYAEAEFPFQFLHPDQYDEYARSIFEEVKNLIKTGSSSVSFDLSGVLKFQVVQDFVMSHVSAQRIGTRSYLEMDKKDIMKISSDLKDDLTSAEINFVSLHPVQAPVLLRIKNYAKNKAAAAHAANPLVPEGSYRHILWNYLLTRHFDADFAKLVTDAHEIGDREGEDAQTHLVDFHNNAIGRRYAQDGIPETAVLSRLLRDGDVVRKD